MTPTFTESHWLLLEELVEKKMQWYEMQGNWLGRDEYALRLTTEVYDMLKDRRETAAETMKLDDLGRPERR